MLDLILTQKIVWSDGAMVLGKLLVPGRPSNLDYRRARACCTCSRCGWGFFRHFFSHLLVGWLVVLGLTAL